MQITYQKPKFIYWCNNKLTMTDDVSDFPEKRSDLYIFMPGMKDDFFKYACLPIDEKGSIKYVTYKELPDEFKAHLLILGIT